MTDELTIWQPRAFEGTDLLPLSWVQSADLEIVGDDNIEESDTIIPALKLLQGTAVNEVEGARAGQFYNTVTKELFDSPIRVLAIAHTKGASYFPPDGSPDENCYSTDGVEGSVYGLCSECGKSEWDRSDPSNHKKPVCNKQHRLIVMTSSGPALIRFQSTSYKALQGFLTTKKMQRKNFFDHPLYIYAKGPFKKEAGGKSFTFFTTEVKWDTADSVPLDVRKMALDTYKALQDAASHGKLRDSDDVADSEQVKGDSDIPF